MTTGARQDLGRTKYALVGTVHTGAQNEIFLAQAAGPAGFSKHIVIKVPREGSDGVAHRRLIQEARILAALDHPNIVRVSELTYVSGGRPALAMEYVRGHCLSHIVQRTVGAGCRCPVRVVLYIVARALNGLHHAHLLRDERGEHLAVLHRGISLRHVMIGVHGEVKLIDFSKSSTRLLPAVEEDRIDGLTGATEARYLAPERARGERTTAASDVYSMGVLMAEALTGVPLFSGGDPKSVVQRAAEEPREETIRRVLEHTGDVPGLAAALFGALAIRPSDRFVSAHQFAETLDTIAKNQEEPATQRDVGRFLCDLYRLPASTVHDGGPAPRAPLSLGVPVLEDADADEELSDTMQLPSNPLPRPRVPAPDVCATPLASRKARPLPSALAGAATSVFDRMSERSFEMLIAGVVMMAFAAALVVLIS